MVCGDRYNDECGCDGDDREEQCAPSLDANSILEVLRAAKDRDVNSGDRKSAAEQRYGGGETLSSRGVRLKRVERREATDVGGADSVPVP